MIDTTPHMASLSGFRHALLDAEKSANTTQKYLRDARAFLLFLGSKALEKEQVLAFKAMTDATHAPSGTNSILASVNAFLRYLGRADCCVKALRLQKKAYCSKETEMTKQDYFALLRAAAKQKNERLSLILQTLCATGIRVSELQFITCEAISKGETTVKCKGKTRRILLLPKLCKKLSLYASRCKISSGALFITRCGKPMDRSNIWREMKQLCTDAGVCPKKVFPHNLRHLFARTFYSLEKDIAKLADILGHSSINTTRIYIITSGDEHRKKLENMHLIM